jgi:DNA-binding response OmpR family regulator
MKPTVFAATILVVDDNRENLNVIGNLFKDQGHKLAFATNGKDALEIVETTKVDLILLDVMMPGMDGFEVCKELKSHAVTRDIPVIFLTAKNELDDVVTGFLLGGVDYVTKPFKMEELLCRVKTHLDLQEAREMIQHQAHELRESNRMLLDALGYFGKFYERKK